MSLVQGQRRCVCGETLHYLEIQQLASVPVIVIPLHYLKIQQIFQIKLIAT